jgi:protocatechuate 3,4-dioxygenase alpha subunit
MDLIHTANQPIGPYFHFALTPDTSKGLMAGPDVKGERVCLAFRVLDRDGKPVTNAMLELWQADIAAFGRLASDDDGMCLFETVKPGRVPGWSGKLQAPHINVSIYAPGLLRRAVTRIYFAGDSANGEDQVLNLVPENRRPTLMAHRADDSGRWNFDVYLTGPCETVFFDI